MKKFSTFFSAVLAILLMAVAIHVAFDTDLAIAAASLFAGSLLISYIPKLGLLETVVPPVVTPETKEIKTSADLLKELGEIKAGLEKKAKEDAKEEVTEQLKAVNASIEEVKNKKPEVTA